GGRAGGARRLRDVDRQRLVPDVVLEAVERGRTPVAGLGWCLYLEDGGRPPREVDAPVLAAPDVGDADLVAGRVRVPALPVDDAARRDRGGRRSGDGRQQEQGARDE